MRGQTRTGGQPVRPRSEPRADRLAVRREALGVRERDDPVGDIAASASASYSITWTARTNECTPSPLAKCAQPPVGSTWLDPAM